MMWIFLLLPAWGLELVIIPIFAWYLADPRWHPYIAVAAGLALLATLTVAVRAIRRERPTADVIANTKDVCIWGPGIAACDYKEDLVLFLRLRGWRVASASVGPNDRIEVVAGKDRYRIALLLLPPTSGKQTPDDLSRLRKIMRAEGATGSAVVSLQPGRFRQSNMDEAGIRSLRFRDLSRLDDAMQIWS
jgi:hypothetical protein